MNDINPDLPSGYEYGFFAAYFAIIGVIIVISIVIAAAYYVVMAIALSTFFRKVGVKPWIAWVPFYNNWVWLEVGGQRGWLSLLSIVPYGGIVSAVFLYIGMYRSGIAFRKHGGYVVLGIFLPFVWAFILGSRAEVYQPELITAAGFPPPLAGYGSVAFNYASTEQPAPGYGTQPPSYQG
ncbi:DUF5684 domain-containing protein [Glaciihabitans sp. UYNi722]|uniref:DUF5684 domain-containing protein n=1 Tax=Glaciihabitans sp. UYNi722 TaxID=3156344 RepID=UPI003396C831